MKEGLRRRSYLPPRALLGSGVRRGAGDGDRPARPAGAQRGGEAAGRRASPTRRARGESGAWPGDGAPARSRLRPERRLGLRSASATAREAAARARFHHAYEHPGRYTIAVRARDRVGNLVGPALRGGGPVRRAPFGALWRCSPRRGAARPGPAAADFGPIQLVSKSTRRAGRRALAPAISADGRYLAFQGTIGGLRGVFREDLETGAVATGRGRERLRGRKPPAPTPAHPRSRPTAATSASPRRPAGPGRRRGQPASSDVYVADMSAHRPAYELASALDGSGQGLAYQAAAGCGRHRPGSRSAPTAARSSSSPPPAPT